MMKKRVLTFLIVPAAGVPLLLAAPARADLAASGDESAVSRQHLGELGLTIRRLSYIVFG